MLPTEELTPKQLISVPENSSTWICDYEGELDAQQAEDFNKNGFVILFKDTGIQLLADSHCQELMGLCHGKLACFKIFETVGQFFVMAAKAPDQPLFQSLMVALKHVLGKWKSESGDQELLMEDWNYRVTLALICWGQDVHLDVVKHKVFMKGVLVHMEVNEQEERVVAILQNESSFLRMVAISEVFSIYSGLGNIEHS